MIRDPVEIDTTVTGYGWCSHHALRCRGIAVPAPKLHLDFPELERPDAQFCKNQFLDGVVRVGIGKTTSLVLGLHLTINEFSEEIGDNPLIDDYEASGEPLPEDDRVDSSLYSCLGWQVMRIILSPPTGVFSCTNHNLGQQAPIAIRAMLRQDGKDNEEAPKKRGQVKKVQE
jgi:hypothetical protein